jgi:transposase
MLDAQIRQLNHEITPRWGDDPRVHRLCTIPGIGPFIATVLVLELGDIARFAHAKQVASYIGLTPRIRASADRIRTGRITKEGNWLLRYQDSTSSSSTAGRSSLSASPTRCRSSSPTRRRASTRLSPSTCACHPPRSLDTPPLRGRRRDLLTWG